MLKFTKSSASTYISQCGTFEIVNNAKCDNDSKGWDLYSTFSGCKEFECTTKTKKAAVAKAEYIK